MKVKVENIELRGYEIRTSTQANGSQYGVMYFEEESGRSSNILVRDLSLLNSSFKKGSFADLTCELGIGKYTKFELLGIELYD